MNISIKFTNEKIRWIDGMPHAFGEIKIDNYIEDFFIPLEHWNFEDYERQWKEGLERIKRGEKHSCIVTAAFDTCADIWGLCREKKGIYMYMHILNFKRLPQRFHNKPFNPETCYEFNKFAKADRLYRDNDIKLIAKLLL